MIHGGGCQEERLYEHGDAGEYAGHSVNALPSIAVGILEGDAPGYQRVHEGRITPILAVLQRAVQGSDIFPPEALYDEYHHILLHHGYAVVRNMNGAIDCRQLYLVLVVFRYDKDGLADGAV